MYADEDSKGLKLAIDDAPLQDAGVVNLLAMTQLTVKLNGRYRGQKLVGCHILEFLLHRVDDSIKNLLVTGSMPN